MTKKSCYWIDNTGKCSLSHVPDDWIYEFLARAPKARRDLLTCAMHYNDCPEIGDSFIEFAENPPKWKDAQTENDEWQKFVNKFVDHHRKRRYGFDPDTEDGSEEDEDIEE